MPKKELCQFGKEIGHALVELNQTKEWLVAQVAKTSGLYFDRSYLHKIEVGESSNPKIVKAIGSVLGLTITDNL